jgi:hypothetical protein
MKLQIIIISNLEEELEIIPQHVAKEQTTSTFELEPIEEEFEL